MQVKKTILLVDDDELDVKITLRALKLSNISNAISVVSSGTEALDYLNKKELPGFILLDLHMPQMNGMEVLQQIKQNERTRNIPVIILTASEEKKDVEACFSHGAAGYFLKSFEFPEFTDKIKTLLAYWGASEMPE